MSDIDYDSDPWAEFIEPEEPIGLNELQKLNLAELPPEARVWVLDDYFPETTIRRDGERLICQIEEHIYTKYWTHKFSAYAFARAMGRAIRRLMHEGHPFDTPEVDDEDVHIYVRWGVVLPVNTTTSSISESVKAAYDLVYARADSLLDHSDSVLVLGKDTGSSLTLLHRIADRLEELGYYGLIIKGQPDKLGESVIQKVMRYALTCKFVLIENTEPSGHLYEIPHVAKSAECVTVFLQERGKGATWMFTDAFAKHTHWHKLEYDANELEAAVEAAAAWAEAFIMQFGSYQKKVLPWMKS